MNNSSFTTSDLDAEYAAINRLHFKDDRIEDAYQKKFIADNLYRHQIALIIGIVATLLFLIQDLKTFPESSVKPYLIIRLGICVPLFIAAFIVTRIQSFQRSIPNWVVTTVVVYGLGCVAIVAINAMHGHVSPYEGILVTIIAAYFLVGLDFRLATFTSVLITIAYVMMVFTSDEILTASLYSVLFLITTLIICLAGGFGVEKQLRINFLTNEKLKIVSQIDGLSGVLNRGAMEQHLTQLLGALTRTNQGIAVCLIDIDYFKNYNDYYGHQSGDNVIKLVAQCLNNCCRRPFDFCARYGGEEFLLVWYPAAEDAVESMKETIIHQLAQLNIPHQKSAVAEHVTISAGIAYFNAGKNLTPEEIIKVADEALYEAKEQGRNRILISGQRR